MKMTLRTSSAVRHEKCEMCSQKARLVGWFSDSPVLSASRVVFCSETCADAYEVMQALEKMSEESAG